MDSAYGAYIMSQALWMLNNTSGHWLSKQANLISVYMWLVNHVHNHQLVNPQRREGWIDLVAGVTVAEMRTAVVSVGGVSI